MTPTPPETSSSGRSPEEQFRVKRTRNRVPLSCQPCRTRNKCDRGHPCSNCVKREGGGASSCSYATPASKKRNQNQGSSTPGDMQNRIDRLEGLVLSLMQGGANVDQAAAAAAAAATARNSISTATGTDSGTGPSPQSNSTGGTGQGNENENENENTMDDDYNDGDGSDVEDDLATSLGVLKVDPDKGKSMYIGQEHWHMIMKDIAEVKNYFACHKQELEKSYETVRLSKPPNARDGPTLLLGQSRAPESEIRAGLPPKSSVFTLCGRFFNSMDNGVYIIHAPTFQQQLRKHWEDPSKTSIMWLGLLYAIMNLAMLSYHKVGDEPPEWKGRTLDMAVEFRLRTVQCLIEADFTRPAEYTVETMVLYVLGEYSSRWDADLGLWLICSLIIRVAYRMGYHRDPRWFSSITPFQGEMRRRIWHLLRMSDVILSYQVSLPHMIQEDDCDVEIPRSIYDDEFGPDSKELPPSRPIEEATPIAYMILKVKLANEMGNILTAVTKVRNQPSYDQILQHDTKLRAIMRELPPHLKLQPLEGSHDPVTLIIARFNIDILYNKIMCVLHRKYLERARHNTRYAHSRRSAIEAALETLQHLATLHRESQPSGRLRSIKWYINATATKDFLLPAMMVVMDLHRDNMAAATGRNRGAETGFFWSPEQRMNMIGNLELTRDVWSGLADSSIEAMKASKIMEIMLDKVRAPETPSDGQRDDAFSEQGLGQSQDMRPEHSAAATLDMMPDGLTPNTSAVLNSMQNPGPAAGFGDMDAAMNMAGPTGLTPNFQGDLEMNNPQSPFSMFTNLEAGGGDLMANFDWNAFESYTQSANWGTDNSFMLIPPAQATQQQNNNNENDDKTGGPYGSGFPNPNMNI